MRITLTNLFVNDQKEGIKFYKDILGFEIKQHIEVGEYAWVTLVSPEDKDGCQLTIDPSVHPAAKNYKDALYKEGIPATSFASTNLVSEVQLLKSKGVHFKTDPKDVGPAWIAVFDDSCGNWIQLHQNK